MPVKSVEAQCPPIGVVKNGASSSVVLIKIKSESYLTALRNSHNYAPLRSSVHVLETLQEVFFWDGVHEPRPVSLDSRNIVKSLSIQSEFESWE
ncbi:hypothetical protein TNCV_5114771 [Trichonephila clavipes]|nr:hypothetical protein TNCV_5114771 [Trichonephila clavipes]